MEAHYGGWTSEQCSAQQQTQCVCHYCDWRGGDLYEFHNEKTGDRVLPMHWTCFGNALRLDWL